MVIADDIGGRRNKNSIMRVLPFQSQTMEQKGPDVQLPPKKNGCSRGWLSFICFGHTPAEFECPSPPKVGPLPQYVPLKSSLKKPTDGSVLVGGGNDGCIIRKKVRWPDYCGKELIEIKHFQCQS